MALFGIGKVKPEKIWERGDVASGRIVGIEVDETSSGDYATVRVDDYAIEVASLSPFVAGVRQRLVPDDTVRLGMQVVVRHLDGNVVIDWPATCTVPVESGLAALVLKAPPAPGIVDETLGLKRARKKGVAATATVTGAEVRDALLGVLRKLHLDITVRADGIDEYASELKGVVVPHYATHLCEIGTVLPAWVRPDRVDRVTIDWPAAAMADPGVGRPPAAVLAGIGDVFTGTGEAAHAAPTVPDDRPIQADVSHEHTPIDGVSFDLWVAVEVGLQQDRVSPADYDTYAQGKGAPAGAWAGAQAGWQQRMTTDWRLGAAFGEAFEAVRKGRK